MLEEEKAKLHAKSRKIDQLKRREIEIKHKKDQERERLDRLELKEKHRKFISNRIGRFIITMLSGL